jgi:sporulation protein YlmC with PRC-barrel domain
MNDANPGLPEIFRTREFVGWEVVDASGDKLGTVADLLIDGAGRVRFVDVEYGFPRKHFLLPQDRLQWGERRLVADAHVRGGFGTLPPYDPSRPLDSGMVTELSRAYPAVYDVDAHDWRAPAGEARVVPLGEAKGFKLEKGAPDLRGWNVFGSDGERVGTVSQLLVDPTALKIRYAAVDVHEDLYRLRDDRHVLVPLELLDLKERGNDVWVQRLTAAEVARLPAYTGGAVAPAMEMAVQRAFGSDGEDKALPPAQRDRAEIVEG